MDEEDGCSARTWAGSLVDDFEAALFERVEGRVDVGDAEREVGEAAAATVAVDEFLHGRVVGKRLEQLDAIGTAADFEEYLPDLIGAEDYFAMDLAIAEGYVAFDLSFELATLDCDGDMVNKLEAWDAVHERFPEAVSFSCQTAPVPGWADSDSLPVLSAVA